MITSIWFLFRLRYQRPATSSIARKDLQRTFRRTAEPRRASKRTEKPRRTSRRTEEPRTFRLSPEGLHNRPVSSKFRQRNKFRPASHLPFRIPFAFHLPSFKTAATRRRPVQRHSGGDDDDPGYMNRKIRSLERINSIRETNASFDPCSSCKRLVSSYLHELHVLKISVVSRIEFIRSKLSNLSAHVSGVTEAHRAMACLSPSLCLWPCPDCTVRRVS